MGVAVSGDVNDLAERLARGGKARDAGALEAALEIYQAAATAFPDEPEPHHHLGGLQARLGRLDLAEAAYRRVLQLAPAAGPTKRVLAVLLLSQGRFEEGFALFEARHELASMAKPEMPWPEWRGEPIAGKRLLIWPEQGFGDQIQAARFAPVVAARGARVTLLCAPALQRLFAGSLTGVEVAAAAGQVNVPDPDYWVMSGSLAARLGVTVETIPGAPYLRPVSEWPPLGDGFRIGLAWRGNPAYENDANRSLPEAEARRLSALPARVVDLDPAASGARDFADTAAIMRQLDLVISVDSAPAHLAGALGRPCWTLLPAAFTDWRWLRERTDTPWYPSMTLYRQQPDEPWSAVVDRVIADVGRLIASR